ncbi:hypothetical protein ABHI18_012231 [Aspergillus niger]
MSSEPLTWSAIWLAGVGQLASEHWALSNVAGFVYAQWWTLNHLHAAIEAQPSLSRLSGKLNDPVASEAGNESLLVLPLFSAASSIA